MRKQDTYDLAEKFLSQCTLKGKPQLSLAFDELPETLSNAFLAKTVAQRIAIHNADLTDEERQVVEQHLLEDKLDVVFATSTLAAGVNFPLGAAIFPRWKRWSDAEKTYIPIESAEFHNMAGRVGRMGFEHEHGRIIFIAQPYEVHIAAKYLRLGDMPSLDSRVTPERFNQLSLQLVASGLCSSKKEVESLVCSSFSAQREQSRNAKGFSNWPTLISRAIDEIVDEALLIQTSAGKLTATPFGKAVAISGLLPESGVFLLDYIANKAEKLIQLLPTPSNIGDTSRLSFLLFCACFSTPDFRPFNGKAPTRLLPWPLDKDHIFDADIYKDDLPEPVWYADLFPINAAKLTQDWIDGTQLRELEAQLPNLRAGMLLDMYRNLAWALQGLASIMTGATDTKIPIAYRPKSLRNPAINLNNIRMLAGF